MNTRYIIGNWKMNPISAAKAKEIFRSIKRDASTLKKSVVGICPPAIYFEHLRAVGTGKKVLLGIQNIHWEKEGSHTGEISAAMAKDLGAAYCIVGHSERRYEFGEDNAEAERKVKAALKAGLSPILCVGERDRDEDGSHFAFIEEEITTGLGGVAKKDLKNVLLAYEPVWAIGAKDAMNPRKLQEMSIFIRRVLADRFGKAEADAVPVLYGGSVNPTNTKGIMEEGRVDGLLIGRASREPQKMKKIMRIVEEI